MNQEIINYIKKNLARGVSQGQIRQALLTSGWQQTEIDAAFIQLENPQSPPPPTAINPQSIQNPPLELKEQKNFLTPTIFVVVFLVVLFLIIGGVGAFLTINKTKTLVNNKEPVNKNEIKEQRLIYSIKSGNTDDYLTDIEVYSVKLDGTDQKLIAKARKDDLILNNNRIRPFYDALILLGKEKPFAIIDEHGNDLSKKYNPNSFEFIPNNLPVIEPTLSSDGQKVAFNVNENIGIGTQFKSCQSGDGCPIYIRDLKTDLLETKILKFDTQIYSEILTVGWSDNENFIIGTGCYTTGCMLDVYGVGGTWALNIKTGKAKIHDLQGSPPFLLPGSSKFVYGSYDTRCKVNPQYTFPLMCAIKLVDLEKGEKKTLVINENVSLTPVRLISETQELFFLEMERPDLNPSNKDLSPIKLTTYTPLLKSIKLDSKDVETSTLNPVYSAEFVIDVSMDGKYVIFRKKEDGLIKIKSKNLKTGQEYEVAREWSQYIGLIPESIKRARIGLLAGPVINNSPQKPSLSPLTETKSVDKPTQLTLVDCAVVQDRSLFPNTLTLNKIEYPKQGQPINNELSYVNGTDSITISVNKKGDNKESYESLKITIQSPAVLGEDSIRVKKDLFGESVLFSVAKLTTGKYKWSIGTTIADDMVILFQGPTNDSKVEMSNIEELFSNWFQNVCGKM